MARLLIVDDDRSSVDLAVFLLQAFGHETVGVCDSPAAFELATRERFDAILLDIVMPELPGEEFCRALRADPARCATPIFALTASAMAGERERLLRCGFDAYMSKPIDPQTFVSDLEALLSSMSRIGSLANDRRVRDALRLEVSAMSRRRRTPRVREDPLDETLYRVLDEAMQIRRADFGNVQLFDAAKRTLSIAAHRGFDAPFLNYFKEVRIEDGCACAQAMSSKAVTICADVETDRAFTPHLEVLSGAGVRAVESRPVLGLRGDLLAVLSVHYRRPLTALKDYGCEKLCVTALTAASLAFSIVS